MVVGRWHVSLAADQRGDRFRDRPARERTALLGIRSRFDEPTARIGAGLTVNDPSAAFQGYTFFTGFRHDSPNRFDAYLLDLNGKIVHRWDTDLRRIWPHATHINTERLVGNVEITAPSSIRTATFS